MTGRVTSPLSFLILILSFLSVSCFAEESTWIPYKAIYVASLNGTVVDDSGRRELKYLGNQKFRFTAIAENMLFKIEEVSEFEITDGSTIRPLQYQSTRSNPFKKRTKAVGFDWEKNLLHFQDRKRSGSRPMPENIFDPLSSVFELAKQVKANIKTIEVKEASGRKIKERVLSLVGEETIELPIGKLKAIKLKNTADKRETTIWLVPSLNHIAAKVKQVNEGEVYELALKSYNPQTPITFQKIETEEETTVLTIEPTPVVLEEDIK